MQHDLSNIALVPLGKHHCPALNRVFQEQELTDDGAIYDELDEDQYRAVVKGRLQEDDFVEDDGVGGYVDNGMDEWGGGGESEYEDDDDDDGTHARLFQARRDSGSTR